MWSHVETYNAGSRNLSFNFFDMSVRREGEREEWKRGVFRCVTFYRYYRHHRHQNTSPVQTRVEDEIIYSDGQIRKGCFALSTAQGDLIRLRNILDPTSMKIMDTGCVFFSPHIVWTPCSVCVPETKFKAKWRGRARARWWSMVTRESMEMGWEGLHTSKVNESELNPQRMEANKS